MTIKQFTFYLTNTLKMRKCKTRKDTKIKLTLSDLLSCTRETKKHSDNVLKFLIIIEILFSFIIVC